MEKYYDNAFVTLQDDCETMVVLCKFFLEALHTLSPTLVCGLWGTQHLKLHNGEWMSVRPTL